ncbi:MAG: copper resistance D family protein [Gemmatimonadaceae bacterium]
MTLTDPLRELLGFLGAYLSIGVVGLRYAVLGPVLKRPHADASRAALFTDAGRRAAIVGLVGIALAAGLLVASVVRVSHSRHLGLVNVLIAGHAERAVDVVLYAGAIVGFGLVIAGFASGWPLAALGTLGAALSSVLGLRWTGMVNPIHILAGSLWIGTLFVLMAIAVPTVLTGSQSSEDKALTVADLVHAFSPLALTAVAVLVASGVTTAVRHLKYVAALWTTSYGITLIIKLCVVAVVLGLGAWNWRRVRPSLGTPAASETLKRSARLELTFAGLVLLITSVLVSLPSPRLPK